MSKFSPPPRFDFTKPSLWPEWKEQFQTFRIASKLHKDDGTVQVHSLLYAMGPEATKVFKNFKFPVPTQPAAEGEGEDAPAPANPREDFDTVLRLFDEYFIPKKNVFHERARFYARSQQPGESVESFIRAISDLSLTCSFGNANEQIRDRLVLGLQDQEVARKLQLEDDPTLEDAISTARHYELVNAHISSQGNKVVDALSSRGTHSRGHSRGRRGEKGHSVSHTSGRSNCGNCGKLHTGQVCPAKGKQCRACSKYNHFAAVCRSNTQHGRSRYRRGRGTSRVHEIGLQHESDADSRETSRHTPDLFFDIDMISGTYEPPWREKLLLGDKPIVFKLDSGADLTVISKDTYEKHFSHIVLKSPSVSLRSVGQPLKCLGRFETTAQHKNKTCPVEVFVTDSNSECLLGRTTLVRLDLVKRIDLVKQVDSKVKDPLFGDLDQNPIKTQPVKIVLKDDCEPYSVH